MFVTNGIGRCYFVRWGKVGSGKDVCSSINDDDDGSSEEVNDMHVRVWLRDSRGQRGGVKSAPDH